MTKKYKNSPLTEVVAEFNFIPSKSWNSTIVGEFYSHIKSDFPEIKQRDDQIMVAVPTEEKPQERVQIGFVELVQFWNDSKNLLVQIGKDMLTINSLKPYSTWESFFPLVIKIFRLYCTINSPIGLMRANLRYINTIEVANGPIRFDGNFKLPMPVPHGLRYDVRFVNTHLEYDINEADVLAQKITSVPTTNLEVKNLILQIEVVMNRFKGLAIDDVSGWLQKNHMIIIDTFESTTSDELKKKFDQV